MITASAQSYRSHRGAVPPGAATFSTPRRAPPAVPVPPREDHGLAASVELRELRYFAAAARAGNLAGAARALNVTASAISQQLRNLEGALGTPLLTRHGRGVTATPAGQRLLERIDAVVRLLDAPLGPQDPRAAPEGSLSVALPAELATLLAVPILTALHRQLPSLVPTIRESADGMDSLLLAGQVDLAVLPDPPDLDELHIDRVMSGQLGVVASPRSALAARPGPLRLPHLERLTLVLPGKRHWIRRLLARTAFQRGVRLEPAFEVDSLAATKVLVQQGAACSVLPAMAVRDELARGALVFCPLVQPALATTYAIGCARSAPAVVRDAARVIRDAVRAAADEAEPPGTSLYRAAEAADGVAPAAAPWAPLRQDLEFVEGD